MTSDDLRATIARLRGSVERNAVYGYRDLVIEDDDLTALLDAAERAQELEKALEATNERLLARIDQLMDAKPDTPEGSELQRLVDAVQPIEAVLYFHAPNLKEPTHD